MSELKTQDNENADLRSGLVLVISMFFGNLIGFIILIFLFMQKKQGKIDNVFNHLLVKLIIIAILIFVSQRLLNFFSKKYTKNIYLEYWSYTNDFLLLVMQSMFLGLFLSLFI